MDKFKEKLKNIKIKDKILDHKFLLICLFVVLLFLGNMIKVEYSRCTYRMYANPYMEEYNHFIVIGRYIVAIFWKVVNVIGLSLQGTYFLSYIIGIVCMVLSINILFNILKEDIKNKFLNLLVSTAIILNSFFIDYFIYLEKGVFALSILFSVLAVKYLIEFFKSGKKRNISYTLLLLCLTSFSYQGTVALFIGISTIYIVKYSSNIKKFIYNNVITALIYGVTMGVSYILVRLVGNGDTSRTTGALNIIESIKRVIKGLYHICIDSYGTMPKYMFLLTFLIVFAIITIIIFKSKNKDNKGKALAFFGYIYILFACVIVSVLPQFAIDTVTINISARAIYPVASIIALSIAYLFVNVKFESTKCTNIIIAILVIYLSIQCYEFNKITIDHYTLNYVERDLAFSIGEKIENYEKEHNTKVTKIVFYNDKDSKYSYENLKSYGDINERVFRTTWSRVEILNYYLNRDFVQEFSKNEEYKKEFESVDYKQFNEKQVKFEGDTLHLCIY